MLSHSLPFKGVQRTGQRQQSDNLGADSPPTGGQETAISRLPALWLHIQILLIFLLLFHGQASFENQNPFKIKNYACSSVINMFKVNNWLQTQTVFMPLPLDLILCASCPLENVLIFPCTVPFVKILGFWRMDRSFYCFCVIRSAQMKRITLISQDHYLSVPPLQR